MSTTNQNVIARNPGGVTWQSRGDFGSLMGIATPVWSLIRNDNLHNITTSFKKFKNNSKTTP